MLRSRLERSGVGWRIRGFLEKVDIGWVVVDDDIDGLSSSEDNNAKGKNKNLCYSY